MKRPKFSYTEEQLEWFREQGVLGGTAAAASMTKAARKERALKAVTARWAKVREISGHKTTVKVTRYNVKKEGQ